MARTMSVDLVHDDDGGGTQTSLGVLKGVEVYELVVGDRLGNNGSRRTAGNDGIQVVPAATDTSAVLLDQLAQRDGHLLLNSDGVADVTGDTEQLGIGVTLTTEGRELAGSAAHDGGNDSHGLDIGDGTGATE